MRPRETAGKLLAMTTPWCIELDQYKRVTLQKTVNVSPVKYVNLGVRRLLDGRCRRDARSDANEREDAGDEALHLSKVRVFLCVGGKR